MVRGLIFRTIRKICFLFDENIFCCVCNVFFFFLGKTHRFSYVSSGCHYIVEGGGVNWSFNNKKQGFNVYFHGLEWRATDIGYDYCLDQISFEKGDLIYDCGANVGDLFLYLKDVALDSNYFGFEPSPKEYASLQRNVGEMNCCQVALASQNSELEFYVSSDHADSSLIVPDKFERTIFVQSKRLDQYHIENRRNRYIKLLKLEAEGAEPEVIQGCDEILSNIEYIAADLGPERSNSSTLPFVVNYLSKRQFEVVDIKFPRGCVLFKNLEFKKGASVD